MAALVATDLTQRGFGDAKVWRGKSLAIEEAGTTAFKVPDDAKLEIRVNVEINSAANFNCYYTISDDDELAAGSHRTVAAVAGAQTANVCFTVPVTATAVIIVLNSGSIDIEIQAK